MARFALVLAALLLGVTAEVLPATAQEGTVASRPDALIRRAQDQAFVGNNIYNRSGAGQTRGLTVDPGRTARYLVQIQNDGPTTANIRVAGTSHTRAFRVRYSVNGRSVSPPVKAGSFTFRGLAPGAQRTLAVEVTPTRFATPGRSRRVVISARAGSNAAIRDNVVAVTRRALFTRQQLQIQSLINGSRRSHGRAALAMHRTLAGRAQRWAEHLAAQNALSHSNFSYPGAQAMAENVGYNSSIGAVHNAFMNSASHRNNILGPYNYVGTGYATRGARVFVVQLFMRV